ATCFPNSNCYNSFNQFQEDRAVLRIRDCLILALVLALVGLSTSSRAQEKEKEKAATTPATADEKVDFKWKFEKDKTIYQEMATKTIQVMKVLGMEVNQVQDQTFYF